MIESANATVSRPGFHKRFNAEAVEFVKGQLGEVIANTIGAKQPKPTDLFKQFNRVLVSDGCKWNVHEDLRKLFKGNGGSASLAACKLQFTYDLKASSVSHAEIVGGLTSDSDHAQALTPSIQAGDLHIGDLGYFSIDFFSDIHEAGAFFLSRYKIGTTLFIDTGDELSRLDIARLLRKNKDYPFIEFNAALSNKLLPCRIVCSQLPDREYQEKMRKIKKEARSRGKTVSKQTRLLSRWNIMVTNIPYNSLNAKKLIQIYTLRWSIELLFKQFKSTLALHKTNHKNPFRLACEVFGTLIVAALIMKIHGLIQHKLWKEQKLEVSFEKLFKFLKNEAYLFLQMVCDKSMPIKATLRKLIHRILIICVKDTRPTRKTSLQKVFAPRKGKVTRLNNLTLLRFTGKN